jgi:hypothetical protein
MWEPYHKNMKTRRKVDLYQSGKSYLNPWSKLADFRVLRDLFSSHAQKNKDKMQNARAFVASVAVQSN